MGDQAMVSKNISGVLMQLRWYCAQSSLDRPCPYLHRLMAAMVLTSLLFLGSGLISGQAAIALSPDFQSAQQLSEQSFQLITKIPATGEPANRTSSLPPKVSAAVLKQAAKRSGLPQSALRIVQAEAKTWPDGCLGIREPDVFCTQALVPGWRVVVAAGSQRWVYRTNGSGSVVSQENGAVK
ncbi:MAG: hypothetical protein VKJ46_03765 [Leptolyngbyaceae bacterium]|nr:hypothetical protein [Leptolyngbyaceae bacterium]